MEIQTNRRHGNSKWTKELLEIRYDENVEEVLTNYLGTL